MSETSVATELPVALQWAAGVLTVMGGVFSMIWALRRKDSEVKPISVYSTQPMNDVQMIQMLMSSQSLMLVELQRLNGNVNQTNQHLESIADTLRDNGRVMNEVRDALERRIPRR